jgi:hypothetical protein
MNTNLTRPTPEVALKPDPPLKERPLESTHQGPTSAPPGQNEPPRVELSKLVPPNGRTILEDPQKKEYIEVGDTLHSGTPHLVTNTDDHERGGGVTPKG